MVPDTDPEGGVQAMASGKQVQARRIRILEALQGRRLEEVYFLDPAFRQDLRREAARGDVNPGDALLTGEMLEFLEESLRRRMTSERVTVYFGAAPSAGFALGSPSATLVPAPSDVEVVLIVPGNLFSQLWDLGGVPPTNPGCIWFNLPALLAGRFLDLELAPYDGNETDANPHVQITAAGVVGGLFDMLQSYLSDAGYASLIYPYDWRKDIDAPVNSIAAKLSSFILGLGQQYRRVHIVTHSLGTTLARKALQLLAAQIGTTTTQALVGNLIMLGPANYGTFAAPLALAGALKQLPLLKLFPPVTPAQQQVLASFTALYELIPWDQTRLPSLGDPQSDVRNFDFWQGLIEEARFARAFPPGVPSWAAGIDTSFLNASTTVIVGYNALCSTAGGVVFNWENQMKVATQYAVYGDGWVPHICSILDGTQAYIAYNVNHIRLPMAPKVITAIGELLDGDTTIGLPPYSPL